MRDVPVGRTDRAADKRRQPSELPAARCRVPESDRDKQRRASLGRRRAKGDDARVGSSDGPVRHNSTARPQRRVPLLPHSALLVLQTSDAASAGQGILCLSHSIRLRSAAALPRSTTRPPTPVAPRLRSSLATPARSLPAAVRPSPLQTDHGCMPLRPRSRRRLPPARASTHTSPYHPHSPLCSGLSPATPTL